MRARGLALVDVVVAMVIVVFRGQTGLTLSRPLSNSTYWFPLFYCSSVRRENLFGGKTNTLFYSNPFVQIVQPNSCHFLLPLFSSLQFNILDIVVGLIRGPVSA